MKRTLAILLLFIYGFSATGMTLHAEYCCGELQEISFSPTTKHCENEGENEDCCQSFQIQPAGDHDAIEAFQQPLVFQIPPVDPSGFLPATNDFRCLPEPGIPPPPKIALDRNHLFCIYRI